MDRRLIEDMRAVEESHWWFQGRRQVLLAILAAHLPDGARLLDVGCGTGFFLEAASRRYDVAGIDPSPEATAFCAARGLSDVRQATLGELGGADDRYDAVTFFDVLEHVEDDLRALRLARDTLLPSGLVFVSVPAYQWLWSPHDEEHGHFRRYTSGLLEGRLKEAGYRVLRTGYLNARLLPLAVAVRTWQRLARRGVQSDLDQPAPWLNRLLGRVFAGEARRLGRANDRAYRAGLSVFAVARAPDQRPDPQ